MRVGKATKKRFARYWRGDQFWRAAGRIVRDMADAIMHAFAKIQLPTWAGITPGKGREIKPSQGILSIDDGKRLIR